VNSLNDVYYVHCVEVNVAFTRIRLFIYFFFFLQQCSIFLFIVPQNNFRANRIELL